MDPLDDSSSSLRINALTGGVLQDLPGGLIHDSATGGLLQELPGGLMRNVATGALLQEVSDGIYRDPSSGAMVRSDGTTLLLGDHLDTRPTTHDDNVARPSPKRTGRRTAKELATAVLATVIGVALAGGVVWVGWDVVQKRQALMHGNYR